MTDISKAAIASQSCEPPASRVYCAIVAPRAGLQSELLALLQSVIVAPLVGRKTLSEFRVLAATPPSFVADDSTLLMFELNVHHPQAVNEIEVRRWRLSLGSDVRLVVANPPNSRIAEVWDWKLARAALTRAVLFGGSAKPPKQIGDTASSRPSKKLALALSACFTRGDAPKAPKPVSQEAPLLCVVNVETGRWVRLEGGTLMNQVIATELCRNLPSALQWKTAWRLAYSPRVHGVSLQTFYRVMSGEGPSILLIQDHHDNVFGGFAPIGWHPCDRYYGNGESFVFRFKEKFPRIQAQTAESPTSPQPAAEGDGGTGGGSADGGTKEGHAGVAAAETQRDEDGADACTLAAEELVQQAHAILLRWRREQQEARRRSSKRDSLESEPITSPTEALDEVLGEDFSGAEVRASRHGCVEHSDPHDFPDGGGVGEDSKDVDDLVEDVDVDMPNGSGALQVFGWRSDAEPFFLFSDSECVAMGGGSGFALYIEKDLLHGMSEPCTTFGSTMLSACRNFIVNELECWVFDDPSEAEPKDD